MHLLPRDTISRSGASTQPTFNKSGQNPVIDLCAVHFVYLQMQKARSGKNAPGYVKTRLSLASTQNLDRPQPYLTTGTGLYTVTVPA